MALCCLQLAAPLSAATLEPVPGLGGEPVAPLTPVAPMAPAAAALSALEPALPGALDAAVAPPAEALASPLAQAGALSAEASASAQKPAASAESARGQGAAIFEGAQAPQAATGDAVSAAPGASAAGVLEPSSGATGAGTFRKPPLPDLPPEPQPFFIRHYRLARAAAWPFLALVYRAKVSGAENLPAGPVVIVPNHVSYVDALMISLAADRPMRYMLKRSIYDRAPRFFRALGAIPVESGDDPAKTAQSLARARAALKNGESLVIFPEGRLSRTGNMAGFKTGFTRIVDGLDVPVVPAHLDNLSGSYFSGREGRTGKFWEAVRALPRRVGVSFGKPLEEVSGQAAHDEVQELSAGALESRVRDLRETLPRAFLRRAKELWGKTALSDSSGKTLTYGKALAASVMLASSLSAKLPAARRVGVLVPPSVGGALANAALAQLGKVPVNLNYTASAEAVAHAVDVAGIETVVTSRKAVEVLKEKGAAIPDRPMIYLEDVMAGIPKWKLAAVYALLRALPRAAVASLFFKNASRSLDDEATIVFTSGSTALPKGVQLTHLNVQSNLEMIAEAYPFKKDDSVLGVLPFFHSFGYTMTLWFPLARGLSAAYHSHPLELGPIAKLAQKLKPTILLATPTFLQRYTAKIPAAAFASLRHVIAGAEKMRGSIADDFAAKFGARPLEGYGATELSPVAAVDVPDRGPQKGSKPDSVGQNLPGTAAKVVDPETGAKLPYGRQGLLMIKGPHVMRGYLNEPEKTAEVLKDGWYATGDVAVIDRDGFIYLKGRWGSRFSKIAGEMAPHEAVEERLHKAAGLAEQTFVVTAVPDEQRGERLVVLYAGYAGDIPALLAKAKAEGLPGLWTPSASSFYRVEAFPVLGSGKLDLKELKALAEKFAGR